MVTTFPWTCSCSCSCSCSSSLSFSWLSLSFFIFSCFLFPLSFRPLHFLPSPLSLLLVFLAVFFVCFQVLQPGEISFIIYFTLITYQRFRSPSLTNCPFAFASLSFLFPSFFSFFHRLFNPFIQSTPHSRLHSTLLLIHSLPFPPFFLPCTQPPHSFIKLFMS